jgi:hypothetical protein
VTNQEKSSTRFLIFSFVGQVLCFGRLFKPNGPTVWTTDIARGARTYPPALLVSKCLSQPPLHDTWTDANRAQRYHGHRLILTFLAHLAALRQGSVNVSPTTRVERNPHHRWLERSTPGRCSLFPHTLGFSPFHFFTHVLSATGLVPSSSTSAFAQLNARCLVQPAGITPHRGKHNHSCVCVWLFLRPPPFGSTIRRQSGALGFRISAVSFTAVQALKPHRNMRSRSGHGTGIPIS